MRGLYSKRGVAGIRHVVQEDRGREQPLARRSEGVVNSVKYHFATSALPEDAMARNAIPNEDQAPCRQRPLRQCPDEQRTPRSWTAAASANGMKSSSAPACRRRAGRPPPQPAWPAAPRHGRCPPRSPTHQLLAQLGGIGIVACMRAPAFRIEADLRQHRAIGSTNSLR